MYELQFPSEILILDAYVGDVKNASDLFSVVSRAMKFPAYFGNNWDALEECLRDMEWLPAKGYVLLLHGASEFWKTATRVAGSFLETWLFCAQEWATSDVAFHLVFEMENTER